MIAVPPAIENGRAHWLKLARRLTALDEAAIEQLSHEPAAIAL